LFLVNDDLDLAGVGARFFELGWWLWVAILFWRI